MSSEIGNPDAWMSMDSLGDEIKAEMRGNQSGGSQEEGDGFSIIGPETGYRTGTMEFEPAKEGPIKTRLELAKGVTSQVPLEVFGLLVEKGLNSSVRGED